MNIKKAFESDRWYSTLSWEEWLKDFKEDVKQKQVRLMIKNCKKLDIVTPLLNKSIRTDRGQQRMLKKLTLKLKGESR